MNVAKTRLFRIWRGMKSRCFNPNNVAFHMYGGRGITVCPEWKASFSAFRDWAISNGYTEHLTLDRYPDPNGNYEPSNCRWATMKNQHRNRTDNVKMMYRGLTLNLADWADIHDLPRRTVYGRFRRGLPPEDVLALGKNKRMYPIKFAEEVQRQYRNGISMRRITSALGIPLRTGYNQLVRGA